MGRCSLIKYLSESFKIFSTTHPFQSPVKKVLLSKAFSTSMEPVAPVEFEEIVEGKASMLYNKSEIVFYNKVQVLNRDISIQVIRLFAETLTNERNTRLIKKKKRDELEGIAAVRHHEFPKGVKILDALAATGLRSVRYLKEIAGVNHVTINDLDKAATDQARKNIVRNNVNENYVTISNMDASLLMYHRRDPLEQYDIIDLDPYGTAVPFLDSAVQAVTDGGLLCVTCTDMPVLSGNYPETCYAKYGTMPIKGRYTHEMSLRILLHAIDSAANKYKRYIEPWLSMSVDFYVRVFVRVHQVPAEVKKSCLKRSYIVQSTQCPSFYLQPMALFNKNAFSGGVSSVPMTCPETGGRMKIGGPFWSAPIHNQEVIDKLLDHIERLEDLMITHPSLKAGDSLDLLPPDALNSLSGVFEDEQRKTVIPSTIVRIKGLLTAMSEELKDVPFYYLLQDLSSALNVTCPVMKDIQSAIINAGYRVSQFHREPNAIKTDAPAELIWDIMRCWCTKNAAEVLSKKSTPTATAILTKAPKVEADFTMPKVLLEPRRKATRFPQNPESNWGPKRRAGRLLKEANTAASDPSVANSGESESAPSGPETSIDSEDGGEPKVKRNKS